MKHYQANFQQGRRKGMLGDLVVWRRTEDIKQKQSSIGFKLVALLSWPFSSGLATPRRLEPLHEKSRNGMEKVKWDIKGQEQ